MAFDMKSTWVSLEVMARCMLTKEDLKLITLEDHQWHLRSSNDNDVDVVEVYWSVKKILIHQWGCFQEHNSQPLCQKN